MVFQNEFRHHFLCFVKILAVRLLFLTHLGMHARATSAGVLRLAALTWPIEQIRKVCVARQARAGFAYSGCLSQPDPVTRARPIERLVGLCDSEQSRSATSLPAKNGAIVTLKNR